MPGTTWRKFYWYACKPWTKTSAGDLACMSNSWMLSGWVDESISWCCFDKIQVYPRPMTVHQLKIYVNLVGFTPHLATLLQPLYQMIWNSATWLSRCRTSCFLGTKKRYWWVRILWVIGPTMPFILIMRLNGSGFDWGLWQKHREWKHPVGIWVQLWKGTNSQNSLVEKQHHCTLLCIPVGNHGTERWPGNDMNSPL